MTDKYSLLPTAICTAVAALVTLWMPVVDAADTLATKPLYLQSDNAVQPNIMFTLDDSGSMQRFYLSTKQSTNDYIVPDDAGAYDPAVNTLYYNPETTYSPWVGYDSSGIAANPDDTSFPKPEQTTLDCNLFTTPPENLPQPVFTDKNKTNYPSGSLSSTDEKNYYLNLKKYYGKGYPCFYYANTKLVDTKYTGGTFIAIVAQPYSLKKDGSTTAISNDSNAKNTYSRANRADCANHQNCTFAEEQANYRNYMAYYSTRIKSAKASVGAAFSLLDDKVRVGFTALNRSDPKTPLLAIDKFDVTQKGTFLSKLYGIQIGAPKISAGTPSRKAVDDVGQYFMKIDAPWRDNPSDTTEAVSNFKACRQSYHILMTDGYWKDTAASVATGDIDGKDGNVIPNHSGGTAIKYKAMAPYADSSSSNTLSDAATYYWKNDLRTDIKNKVTPSQADPAYWQHLSLFAISFGLEGSLSPTSDTLAQITAGTKSWPLIPSGDAGKEIPSKLDDLWHATVNTRGEYFNVKDPAGFVSALTSTFSAMQARKGSSSATVSNSSRLSDTSRLYQASFNSGDWSGELTAYPLDSSGALGNPVWQASGKLPAAASRHIYTTATAGSSAVEFLWANLAQSQKDALNTTAAGTADANGESRLAWVRGDQSKEIGQSGGIFRTRSKRLGDIINSSPVLVSNQNYGVGDADFETSKANRPPMIYVNANDGMMHGFLVSSGVEQFAYIPNETVSKLNKLTDKDYVTNHTYLVDGQLKAGDAKLGDTWKTILLGSTGAGGKTVFALDVTDPANFAANKVMWEYSGGELGYALPQPTMGHLANGNWVALLGNGYEVARAAKLLVLNLQDKSTVKILAGNESSSSGNMNGLSAPTPVDLDGDRVTDLVYAGDLLGNLWRFDLRGTDSSKWTVSKIFTACSAAVCTTSNRQPITARPLVMAHPDGGVMVIFGTGSYFRDGDRSSTALQSLYGIHDKLAASPTVITQSQLVQQTIDSESTATNNDGLYVRVISNNSVDYSTKNGWYLNLISPGLVSGAGERVVSEIQLREDQIVATSMLPSTDPCDFGGKSWLLELSPMTGARLSNPVFDINGDGKIDSSDNQTVDSSSIPVSGKNFDEIISSSTFVTKSDGQTEVKYQSGSSGNIKQTLEAISNTAKGRQSWRQLQ